MAAPTDRPLAPVPGQDTRPGIVLLHLYENGPSSAKRMSYDLLLHRQVIDETVRQLRRADFVEVTCSGALPRITRPGRQYLSWILCTPLQAQRTDVRGRPFTCEESYGIRL